MSLPFQIPVLKLQALQGPTESTTSAEHRAEAAGNSNQYKSNNSLTTGKQSRSMRLLKRGVWGREERLDGCKCYWVFLKQNKEKIKNKMDFFSLSSF